jgi:L-idonate 5-dehydrogenase
VPVATAIARELELVGSFRFNDEIDHVLRALADRSLDVDAVVTHQYPIQDALTALGTAADSIRSGKVLLTFADPDH